MAMVSISHSLSFKPLRQSPLSPPQGFGVRRSLVARRWLNCCPLSISCRSVNLKSRCSITNSDVQCGQILAVDEVEEQVSVYEPDCSAPIVHIKSDSLEAEPLSLLADVDSLLTLLPVLSEEEQKVLAATPAHPVGLYSFYATCLAGNLVEQLWNFALPSALALIHPSLLPVAVMGFFTKLAIIVGGPLIGKLMDYSPRVPSSICLNTVQVAAQLLSAAMVIHAHTVSPTISASSILLRPWFLVLVVAGAIDRLCGLALGVAMERDWVVLLAGINRPIALAQANAILNRIDLLCEIAGASLFAILLSNYDPVTCLKFAVGLMIWSLPVMIGLTLLTNKLSSGVLDQTRSCHNSCGESAMDDGYCIVDGGLKTIKLGWKEYMQQPVLPASLANVLLYFNVVLAPSSLMTAFLTQRGVNPSIIGGFSGLCASMGVAATFLTATLVRHLGILKAGAAGLVFQASLLALAVAVYWSGSLSQQSPVLLFLGLIVLSRLGHMSYDVVSAQILQTGIPSSKANLIGGTEVSVASLAESVMLGVAIIANDVSHFGFLATLSLLSVVGAAWMFCQWLSNPTDEQRTLFSYEPEI